ncbi:Rrf2 family transcriptional regulator [Candidatus Falkowbacteria bacterium CG10_big_fil_rev_8_21_14_0_10_43_10]|uniref:Rrf2 family transcriptional regulator n=1 Tax=Candidatus Falkowbacteria bacterium CG10_big_fil_rev_8_21_14_0_10_43_10 TaxID=1974567 RepID=A0A2H0V217_9BACT|nr:MAG: Rrf2 family transcriptional regulator [Candidatus Falkowbacteria bacterium CG10_big_fil_rev_8_21_14_0_10_43_10]
MKLTTKSEYSLLALICIARQQKDGFMKIDDICKKYNMPKKYLEQLFHILESNRYLRAKRGANGGYALTKTPNKITLAEIIRLMDGALAPTESVSRYFFSHTPIEKEKKILRVLKEIRDYIAERLENLTLADLI